MPHALVVALELAAALAAAKLTGRLCERLGQPAVLGELAVGLALAVGAGARFPADEPFVAGLAQAGVVLLLLETGLKLDARRLAKAGPTAAAVAATGVAVPFLLGWGAMTALGRGGAQAVFTGAALTATSVGITARVLHDLGRLDAEESQIILGAAVLDDLVGVAILAAVSGFSPSALVVVGAFAAGVLLGRGRSRARAAAALAPAVSVLAPLFFVVTGARVRFGSLTGEAWALAALLVVAAVAGKLAAGLAARGPRVDRWAVGFGMLPRGEIGLVFAQMGLASGILDAPLYAAIVLVVVATTFLAPPLLERALVRSGARARG